MTRLVIATGNDHKVEEIWAILSPLVPALAREDVTSSGALGLAAPVEDEVTFAGNALIKARAVAAATGIAALADDSGLAVDVLGGAPGVFSARWSGAHGDDRANLDLLLSQLADVPDQHRRAAFVCAAALVTPGGDEFVTTGTMPGALTRAPRGDGGFGYDPIFIADGQQVTNAELSAADKNAMSHRGTAFRAIAGHVAAVVSA